MRRKDREVKSFDEIIDILSRCKFARTAVVKIEVDESTGKHHLKK